MDEANYAKCSCPSCLNHVAFPTNLVGTVIDCPHCARPLKLELATALSQAVTALDLPTIEAAFQGKVEIRETRTKYKVAVVLVAATMVVMVLLYLAIVAGAAYGLIWHATHHLSLVCGHRSGGALIRWLLYLGPTIILLLLVLFLLKPLLARRAPRSEPLPLDPAIEPPSSPRSAKLQALPCRPPSAWTAVSTPARGSGPLLLTAANRS